MSHGPLEHRRAAELSDDFIEHCPPDGSRFPFNVSPTPNHSNRFPFTG